MLAINTRQKRFSIMTLGQTTMFVSLTPDGTIAQADRQHLLWGYSGILWDEPVVLTPIEILIFASYITTQLDFQSQITTQKDFKSDITTQKDFQSGVY